MVLLDPGEAIVRQATVHRINPQGTREGVLTLTNRRLVFEAQVPDGPQGQPIVRTTVDAPLGRIRNAEVNKATLQRATLEVELPAQRAIFQLPDADVWLQAIVSARAAAPPTPRGGGKGGAPAVVLRCRYCGSLNQPTVTKCASCGAPI